MKYDRYVNNKILNNSLRPQAKFTCATTSMAQAVNTVFESNFTPKDIRDVNGWSLKKVKDGKIGNNGIVNGINTFLKKKGLKGKAKIWMDMVKLGEKNIESAWKNIKAELKNENSAIIYHMKNHYTMLAGYFEEPLNYDNIGKYEFDNRRDWIIISEQSKSWEKPIRIIRWKDIRCDIRDVDNHCLISVKKN